MIIFAIVVDNYFIMDFRSESLVSVFAGLQYY